MRRREEIKLELCRLDTILLLSLALAALLLFSPHPLSDYEQLWDSRNDVRLEDYPGTVSDVRGSYQPRHEVNKATEEDPLVCTFFKIDGESLSWWLALRQQVEPARSRKAFHTRYEDLKAFTVSHMNTRSLPESCCESH